MDEMGDSKQRRLDYLARDIVEATRENVELRLTDPDGYHDDIACNEYLIYSALEEIEQLNPPIGTDAYRLYWEHLGQERLPYAK